MMPHITGLDVLIAAVLGILCVIGAAIVIRVLDRDDRRDPFGPEDDPDGLPGFGTMPPEIAHELAPFPGTETPPAATTAPPAAPGTHSGGAGPGPGTAAADEAEPPLPATPPPLPEAAYAVAQYAIANPGREPFAVWELDEFVEAYNAIHGGTS